MFKFEEFLNKVFIRERTEKLKIISAVFVLYQLISVLSDTRCSLIVALLF